MIPREDFAVQDEELVIELIRDFPIGNLDEASPIRRQLRKPDFQRETNHWSPEQVLSLIESFVDSEVIPSLIFWKSPRFIFVIDGGHRLSALRAWMEDDYGDGPISTKFFNGEISQEQKRTAKYTRRLIEDKIGRFSTLKSLVGNAVTADPSQAKQARRASLLFTRPLGLQWVTGTSAAAESSFYKINSQGTPLDEMEEMLIKNRGRPVPIAARAIVRAGTGNKYWSAFAAARQLEIERAAEDLFKTLFHPEVETPLKTLDVPIGGTSSPLDALSILVDLLLETNARRTNFNAVTDYSKDESGEETLAVLKQGVHVLTRITGNDSCSLGLHPAVYFYNERGKHSRFLLLGMCRLITRALADNNKQFFKNFSKVRRPVEDFLIDHKSLIGALLQNMAKGQRVSKMADMFAYLVKQFSSEDDRPTPEMLVNHLGARARIIEIGTIGNSAFSDDTKSKLFINNAIKTAMTCPICDGRLDPTRSISYDHITRVREGGNGDALNGQLVHPYCNSAIKS